jgi:tol-pal system protein YbgF
MNKIKPFLCFVLLSLTGCAIQKDIAALEYRLSALERQNQQLREQVQSRNQGAEKDLRNQYASTTADIEALQHEARQLNGRIEVLEHKQSRNSGDSENTGRRVEDLSLSVAKMDQRLGQVEQYLDMERSSRQSNAAAQKPPLTSGPAATPPAAPAAPTAVRETEQQLYTGAKQAFDNNEMDKARQGFQKLMTNYPKSDNAGSAQFWIAESYFAEKWYEKAILEYQNVIEKYPKSNKVSAAMLKQAMSFLQLGDKSNARLIFKEVEKKFPQSNEAKIAGQKLKEF